MHDSFAPRPGTTISLLIAVSAAVFGVALYVGAEWLLIVLIAVLVASSVAFTRPVWALYAAIILMPLEGAGRVIEGMSTLTWAKLALVLTLLALVVARTLRREGFLFPQGAALLYVVMGSAAIGTALHMESGGTVWGLLAFAGQALLLVIMYNLVEDTRGYENVMIAVALSSVPVVAVGFADFFTGTSVLGTAEHQVYASATSGVLRVTSTFNDPNALGIFMVFAIAVTVGLLSLKRLHRYQVPMHLLVGMQAVCLIMSFSRGALIALLVAIFVLVLWQRTLVSRIWIAVAIGVITVVISTLQLSQVFQERLLTGGRLMVDASRLVIYAAGVELAWQSPLFGFGPDNVPLALGRVLGVQMWPHNLYLEVLLGVGVVGFCAMAVFIAMVIMSGIRMRRGQHMHYARTALSAVAVVLAGGITLHVFRSNELWIALGLAACLPRITLVGKE